jgi:hypothetical protein
MDIKSGTAGNEAPVCLTSTKADRPYLEVMDQLYGIDKVSDTADELDHNVYLQVGADGLKGLPDLASGAIEYLRTPENVDGGIVGDPNPYFNDGTKQDSYLHGTQHIAFEINGEHTGINTDANYNSLRGQ